jgi:hypothetical protein
VLRDCLLAWWPSDERDARVAAEVVAEFVVRVIGALTKK